VKTANHKVAVCCYRCGERRGMLRLAPLYHRPIHLQELGEVGADCRGRNTGASYTAEYYSERRDYPQLRE